MNHGFWRVHAVFRRFYNMKGLIMGFDVVWIADTGR